MLCPTKWSGLKRVRETGNNWLVEQSEHTQHLLIKFTLLYGHIRVQLVKNQPEMWEIWVQSLGWKDPLEKGKVTYSSILFLRIPWTV